MLNTHYKKQSPLLILSGFDPTGHAGIIKDVQVCRNLKQDFLAFPTALTIQDDQRYDGTVIPDHAYFCRVTPCIQRAKISVVKIGMLGNQAVVKEIILLIKKFKKTYPKTQVVWDPVFRSTSGGELLNAKGIKMAVAHLTPLVDVITPNAIEIREFLEKKQWPAIKNDPKKLCQAFFTTHQRTLYLKGGHFKEKSIDYFFNGKIFRKMASTLIQKNIRGTGCAHSTALACLLAQGYQPLPACKKSKLFMQKIFIETNNRTFPEPHP